ncbi:MAG: DNA repair protein RadC [Flavobacteriales bacterium]|jgi:DNA repair protein RadC|nr:DNA repair protein RadC [Flavobacteriales bacterium]
MEDSLRETKLSIRDWAKSDRPREKLMTLGAGSLSDAELIAILIRSGNTNDSALEVAKKIMASVGNDLHRLARLGVHDLTKFNGVGEAKAISIAAALELGRRRKDGAQQERFHVISSVSAYEFLRPFMADLQHEEFWVLFLDRGNRYLDHQCISKGGMHGTVADPKVIFKATLDRKAVCIVIAHNHPSGQLRPSEEDIKLTKKVVEGGRLLDVQVQDHLIITSSGFYSFADNGMLY